MKLESLHGDRADDAAPPHPAHSGVVLELHQRHVDRLTPAAGVGAVEQRGVGFGAVRIPSMKFRLSVLDADAIAAARRRLLAGIRGVARLDFRVVGSFVQGAAPVSSTP